MACPANFGRASVWPIPRSDRSEIGCQRLVRLVAAPRGPVPNIGAAGHQVSHESVNARSGKNRLTAKPLGGLDRNKSGAKDLVPCESREITECTAPLLALQRPQPL